MSLILYWGGAEASATGGGGAGVEGRAGPELEAPQGGACGGPEAGGGEEETFVFCLLATKDIRYAMLKLKSEHPCKESFTSCQDTSVANLQEANSYSGEVECQKFPFL